MISPPKEPYRRSEDHLWFLRNKVIRRIWPGIVFVGGLAWARAVTFYDSVPSEDKVKQYDAGLALIPEFYRVRADVEALKHDLSRDREISENQREEIIARLNSLDERLTRWFENASRPAKK